MREYHTNDEPWQGQGSDKYRKECGKQDEGFKTITDLKPGTPDPGSVRSCTRSPVPCLNYRKGTKGHLGEDYQNIAHAAGNAMMSNGPFTSWYCMMDDISSDCVNTAITATLTKRGISDAAEMTDLNTTILAVWRPR